jgi:hypothetical protein
MSSTQIKKAHTACTDNANTQSKSTTKLQQLQKFYEYLKTNTATCTQVAIAIGIPQKNLTRYKSKLQKSNDLQVIKNIRCPSTGINNVQLLTTNKELFVTKINYQLNLFDNGQG